MDIQMIVDALQDLQGDESMQMVYSIALEEVRYAEDIEDDDLEEWIALPSSYDINGYHIMELFIDTVPNDTARQWLWNSIRGKGAFRRFRATCERFNLLQDWFAFEEQYYLELAKDWCAENNVPYETFAQPEKQEAFDWNDESQFTPVTEQVERRKVFDGIRIVKARAQNLQTILWMVEEYLSECEPEEEMDGQEWLEWRQERGVTIFIASQQGRPVGFMCVDETIPNVLLDLYVRKDMRRQGIGSQLFQTAIEMDEDTIVYMEPEDVNAQAFLKANGYGKIKRMQMVKG